MSYKLTVDDIQALLVKECGLTNQKADGVVRKFFAIIAKALEEEHYVKVKGLGTFKLIEVDPRRSVDVNTGDSIEIPRHRKVSFTPDTALKEVINKPFAHFESVELNEGMLLDEVGVPEEGGASTFLESAAEDVYGEREEISETEVSGVAHESGVQEEGRAADEPAGTVSVKEFAENVADEEKKVAPYETNGDVMPEEEVEELKRMLKEGEGHKRIVTEVLLALVVLVALAGLAYWLWAKV